MRIGIKMVKPFKKLNNQFIGTQFLIIFIPLIPIQSYFIAGNFSEKRISIGIYWKHVIKIYGIFLSLLASFPLIVILLNNSSFGPGDSFEPIPNGSMFGILLLLIGVMVYFIAYFDKNTSEEIELRELYGKAVGFNALPMYLNYESIYNLKREFEKTFKNKYSSNWRELMKNDNYSQEQIPLLFAIIGYQKQLINTTIHKKWYKEILTEYKKITRHPILDF